MSWVKKSQDDKHTVQAWGSEKPGYAERGKTYESDAKALAGKERRELDELFGKGTATKSPAATSSSSSSSIAKTSSSGSTGVKASPIVSSGNVKKLATAGPSAGNHALPSIFRQSADGATLGSMGSAAFMEKPSLDKSRDINFGSKSAGGTGSGEVSKLSMGSSQTMQRSSIDKSRDINFGSKAAGGTGSGEVSKLSMGSSQTMQRASVDKSRDINFGSKAAGGTGSAEASKLSMGSSQTMERASIDKTRDINFGAKAGSGAKTTAAAKPASASKSWWQI